MLGNTPCAVCFTALQVQEKKDKGNSGNKIMFSQGEIQKMSDQNMNANPLSYDNNADEFKMRNTSDVFSRFNDEFLESIPFNWQLSDGFEHICAMSLNSECE